jgi:general stress protein YciG
MNSGPRAAPCRHPGVLLPTPGLDGHRVVEGRGATWKETQMAATGKDNPGNFSKNREKASEAGKTGGQHQGKENNPANFANNPEKASEAGRAGGHAQGKEHNPGNFANDREKASEAGRKGGQS